LKIILAPFFVLCAASVAVAGEPARHFEVALYGSDVASVQSANNVSGLAGGLRIGGSLAFSQQWLLQVAVALEKHRLTVGRFVAINDPGTPYTTYEPVTMRETYRSLPIDVVAIRRFKPNQRWQPFATLGFHHVTAPNTHPSGVHIPISTIPGDPAVVPLKETVFRDVNDAELAAGVHVQLTRRVGAEGGVTQLLTGSRSQDQFDPRTRVTIGVTWLF